MSKLRLPLSVVPMLDPYGILTDDQWRELHDDLADMARQRRLAYDDLANWSLP